MAIRNDTEEQRIRCSLERIIYYNSQNGYCIASFHSGKSLFTGVGYLTDPQDGNEYELTGRWTTHAKYGRQFAFDSFEIRLPTTVVGIEQFLSSGLVKGIGPSLAGKITRHFGAATLDIINSTPERLLEVEGIGKKKYDGVVAALTALRGMQETMVFLKSHSLSTAHSLRLLKTYGSHVIAVLKENPYQIIDDVMGIGFRTADEIAKKMGVEHESAYRLVAGTRFIIEEACRSGGHCFLPKPEALQRAASLLMVDEAKIERAVAQAVQNGFLVEENDALFPLRLHAAEERSSHRLEVLMRKGERPLSKEKIRSILSDIEHRLDITFDMKQRDAIVHAILHPLTIITGGPGTGKTLCVNGVIELADRLGMKYLLCAPTGRAAKRLSELSGREARTIHRMLEYDPTTGTFKRDEENVFECDLIIVDEVSMADILLFDALLAAVSPKSQVVFVGDVDQLPSVGPGQVLRDLIESKRIFTVRLDTIFRQSETGSIIVNSHRINHGTSPDFSDDFQFIDEETPEGITARIVGLCTTILPQNHRFDPFSDIQVLSPMNNTPCGVKELNRELQQALNGSSHVCWQGSDRRFLMHDKVMQIKNNYEKDVFNGDIGRITGVDKEEGFLTVEFYGRRVEYSFNEADELVLAYATTIHKSQGNEFRSVIIPMTMSHYIMLQRNLLYTGITRAKELLILVGQRKAMAVAMGNVEVRERNTGLRKRIERTV